MLKHELKDKIVAVASNLFKENNYEDVSIREISHLSGISIGSFYRYIGSKEKLFEIFHNELKENVIETVTDKTYNLSGIQKIETLFNIYIDTIYAYGYKCTSFFLMLSIENKKLFRSTKTLYDFLKNYVNEAFNNGEFNKKYDSDYIFSSLYSSIGGTILDWCTCKGNTNLRENFALTFNILINEFKK